MLGRLGWSLARIVGLAFALLGAWVFVMNLVEHSYESWVFVWILLAGLSGAVGGTVFLLSIDGPEQMQKRQVRLLGWVAMLGLALLPSSLTLVLLPMLLMSIPALIHDPDRPPPTVQSVS